MQNADARSERRDRFLSERMGRLIPRLAFPTIAAYLLMSVGNIADTFFVSRLGDAATGAVGVNFALVYIVQGVGIAVGIGSGSSISRLLGAKDAQRASRACTTGVFLSLAAGAALGLLGLLFLEPLVVLMGATPTIAPLAAAYGRWILLSAPFICGAFALNNCLRAEGNAALSMIGIGAGTILNVALDPLFIYTFNLGVAGAALANAISKAVSFLALLLAFLMKRSLLKLSPKLVTLNKDMLLEIARLGLPTLLRITLMSVTSVLTNNVARSYGDYAIAALSIAKKIMVLVTSMLLGFAQGYLPVSGYNWGAKRYCRVLQALRFAVCAGVAGVCALCLLIALFAPRLMGLFAASNPEVVSLGSFSIRTQCCVIAAHALAVLINALFTSIGKAGAATVLSVSRGGLFFIPSLYALSYLFGIWGAAAAQAAADLLSLLLVLPMGAAAYRKINKMCGEQKADPDKSPHPHTR